MPVMSKDTVVSPSTGSRRMIADRANLFRGGSPFALLDRL
jgi:hypothetical protein